MTDPAPAPEEPRGLVAAIRRMAVHDGPGIRTVVFLKGCPLACQWCAAPETQAARPELVRYPERCIACGQCAAACPHGAGVAAGLPDDRERCVGCGACVAACPADARRLVGAEMRPGQVLALVRRDEVFYRRSGGGVTVSGGEPLQQWEFTRALLAACRQAGIHTALETSGFARWERLAAVLEHLDLLLYDLKQMDPVLHLAQTGAANAVILENLVRAAGRRVPVVIRVPVVPRWTDGEANIAAMADALKGLPVRRVDLLPYHRLGEQMYARLGRSYPHTVPPTDDAHLARLTAILQDAGLRVRVGG